MTGLRFFTDRSLGDHEVPSALRAAGWQIVSMRERYGSRTAQGLADVDWIRDAAEQGEFLLTGDKAVAKRPLEARAVVSAGACIFALGKNQLTGTEKAHRFLQHEELIFRRALTRPGPYVVSISARGLETLKLFT